MSCRNCGTGDLTRLGFPAGLLRRLDAALAMIACQRALLIALEAGIVAGAIFCGPRSFEAKPAILSRGSRCICVRSADEIGRADRRLVNRVRDLPSPAQPMNAVMFRCERGDLNPHALRHRILSPARLPFRHSRARFKLLKSKAFLKNASITRSPKAPCLGLNLVCSTLAYEKPRALPPPPAA